MCVEFPVGQPRPSFWLHDLRAVTILLDFYAPGHEVDRLPISSSIYLVEFLISQSWLAQFNTKERHSRD